jgi:hypothetical protein
MLRFIAAFPHLFGLYKRDVYGFKFFNSVNQLYTFFDSARPCLLHALETDEKNLINQMLNGPL